MMSPLLPYLREQRNRVLQSMSHGYPLTRLRVTAGCSAPRYSTVHVLRQSAQWTASARGECQMDRLDAIRVFVRVVESGSFSAVARELGVGQPTLSKPIARLERHLGAQLLMRTSHAVRLTDAGRDFFESSSRLLAELEAAESRIGRGLQAPSGRGRVSVAPGIGASNSWTR